MSRATGTPVPAVSGMESREPDLPTSQHTHTAQPEQVLYETAARPPHLSPSQPIICISSDVINNYVIVAGSDADGSNDWIT